MKNLNTHGIKASQGHARCMSAVPFDMDKILNSIEKDHMRCMSAVPFDIETILASIEKEASNGVADVVIPTYLH